MLSSCPDSRLTGAASQVSFGFHFLSGLTFRIVSAAMSIRELFHTQTIKEICFT